MNREKLKSNKPANFGLLDCQCYHCQQNRNTGNKLVINHEHYKPANELRPNEVNRQSLPGDIDYHPELLEAKDERN